MDWNKAMAATSHASGGGGSGDFLKLADGESAVIAVLGEPEIYLAKPFNEGEAPKQRILLNVFNAATKKPAIFDCSPGVFQQLGEIKAKFELGRYLISIKRKGVAKNTRYTILPDRELSAEQRAHLGKLALPNLAEVAERVRFKSPDETVARPTQPTTAAAMGLTDDQIPF